MLCLVVAVSSGGVLDLEILQIRGERPRASFGPRPFYWH
nr:MAG TPA: hypothetical protein [Caudoviricetes sp.]